MLEINDSPIILTGRSVRGVKTKTETTDDYAPRSTATSASLCESGVWRTDPLQASMQQVGWFVNNFGTWNNGMYAGAYTFCFVTGSELNNSDPSAGWNIYNDGGSGVRNWYVNLKDGQILLGCY